VSGGVTVTQASPYAPPLVLLRCGKNNRLIFNLVPAGNFARRLQPEHLSSPRIRGEAPLVPGRRSGAGPDTHARWSEMLDPEDRGSDPCPIGL